jgi:D-alanyl-D-alanine dipeptidase
MYVANPESGSVHNFGFAVDLSIVDGNGNELDMGTPYDTFNDLAQPQLEEKFFNAGKLSAQQIENRLLLRTAMEKAGFIQLPFEWWHFDALPKAEVKEKFKIIE